MNLQTCESLQKNIPEQASKIITAMYCSVLGDEVYMFIYFSGAYIHLTVQVSFFGVFSVLFRFLCETWSFQFLLLFF